MNDVCKGLREPVTNRLLRTNFSAAVSAARTQARKGAAIVLKVSDLSRINQWKGYETGDHVIETVMSRLDSCLSEGSFVGRLGGGHFLVFLRSQRDGDDLKTQVDQLIAAVSAPIDFGSGELFLNCTVGLSLMPEDATEADQLLCNAELALGVARPNSRAFYTSVLRERLASEAEVRSALVGALERREFFLVYQPQVSTRTGKVIATEALLRWQSPLLGLVPPDCFVPIAESTGLMPELGHWVLTHACRQASRWSQAGRPLRVAVNISAAQLEDGEFAGRVQEVLDDCRLPPSLLELEVTESMLVGQVEQTQRTLRAIRGLGVTLALDDFGTGFSNLAYLRHFSFDTLKIDRLFTSALTGRHQSDVLVRTIIAVGTELGLDIVAEGVETEEQKQVLQRLGCSRMQGYLFGRPVPAGELAYG